MSSTRSPSAAAGWTRRRPIARPAAIATIVLTGIGLPALASAAMGCLIEAERIADIGSPVVGVVERIDVERGQSVKRGQVLAVLRASVERANLDAASARADGEAELKAAEASAVFNRDRLARNLDLFRQHFISQQALDQTRTEAQLADQKAAQAREQRETAQRDRGVAVAQLSQRLIRSPMDGVVAERYVSAGERVDDKPLLRLARVDPLRVQLVVPVALYGQLRAGGLASVQPELPGAAAATARITLIDRVVDPASNTFRVQLELPNANAALPAGLRCKAEFIADAVAPAAPAAPPPAAAPARASPPMARATAGAGATPTGEPPAAAAAVAAAARRREAGIALALTLALPASATASAPALPPARTATQTAAGAAPVGSRRQPPAAARPSVDPHLAQAPPVAGR